MAKKRYNMGEMTWPEIKDALETVKAAIIPVGSQEQHGPNITENCDSVRAEKFSGLLAERLYPKVIVTPTLSFGLSYHHMSFPGTITLSPDTFKAILRDIAISLAQHGINKVIICNAHSGNDAIVEVAIEEIRNDIDIKISSFTYHYLIWEDIKKIVETDIFGHACEFEVSEMLYLAPEYVRKDKITKGTIKENAGRYLDNRFKIGVNFEVLTENGALGDARKANYEIGEKIINNALDEAEKFVEYFMDEV